MTIKNHVVIFLMSAFFIALVPTYIDAIEKKDVYRETLNSTDFRNKYDCDFANYLTTKGIDTYVYSSFVPALERENLKSMQLYRIDSGCIFYDEILFSHPKVKELYNEVKAESGSSDVSKIRELVKKEMISVVEDIDGLINESVSKYIKPNELFKKTFNRNASKEELNWMKSVKTLKYAAYSGELKKVLTEEDKKKIDEGQGYELIGYEFGEYDEIATYIQYSDVFDDWEINFHKSFREFGYIRLFILNSYKIDIFKELSEKERLDIYKSSVEKMRFIQSVALNKTVDLLVSRGLITKVEDKNGNGSSDKNPIQKNNPFVERVDYFRKNKNWKIIQDRLLRNYGEFFKLDKTDEKFGNKELFFKYKNFEFTTGVFVEEKDINFEQEELIVASICEIVSGKAIHSKEKTMLNIEDNLIVYDRPSVEEKAKKISRINELNLHLRKLNIKLYTK